MNPLVPVETGLRVQCLPGLGNLCLWVVSRGEPVAAPGGLIEEWRAIAERTMDQFAEVATFSVVTPQLTGAQPLEIGDTARAATAVLPLIFLSGRTAELFGLRETDHQSRCSMIRLERWVAAATLKGLVHCWLVAAPSSFSEAGLVPAVCLPKGTAEPVPFPGVESARIEMPTGEAMGRPISLGIDASWLGGSESGAQVAAVEMARELSTRADIERIVLLSEGGHVSHLFEGIAKVHGLSWQDAVAKGRPTLDILHRPYQPDLSMDYRRYHRVAHCVALTVLDLIAYDNLAYHESVWSWRRYQEVFEENVCLADCVFAISRHIGSRLEGQFARRLAAPVRPVPLGTDHLADRATGAEDGLEPEVQALDDKPFLVVLGNDFEHKNRDFAVRVFADMRDRGYEGRLVLAGFHLDDGSTYGHELAGAGRYECDIVRMGSVSPTAKCWLLRHAEVVLYPTSCEGFGLVPFEAAALGTPTAFVSFGPLRELLPRVDACASWQVPAFADHVLRLRMNPEAQVAQTRAASAALTWASHVDQVLDGYRFTLRPGAPWQTRRRKVPSVATRLRRTVTAFQYRVHNRLRRVAVNTS